MSDHTDVVAPTTIFGGMPYYAEADSIEDCQKLFSTYISAYNIGGGNWTGSKVLEIISNTHIGDISYNCHFRQS